MTKPPPSRTVTLDPHPPAYKTPIPSLPRAPRMPRDLGPSPSPDQRDTDPLPAAPADSGEYEVSDPEKTPTDTPLSIKALGEKLDRAVTAAEGAATAARLAANNSVTMMSDFQEFRVELKALARRVTALEVSRQWAPILIASLALAGVVWLAFRVQELQHQLQEIQKLF